MKIVYIDDNLESGISYYLYETLKSELYTFEIKFIDFKPESTYDDLLRSDIVKDSEVILIDSKLFRNDSVSDIKFTGEEFKIISRKLFPFKEVIVITQNAMPIEYGTVKKYSDESFGEDKYYEENLTPKILDACNNIDIYQKISEKVFSNKGIDKTLSERILNSINGTEEYDELSKTDIDLLIGEFKKLQVMYDN